MTPHRHHNQSGYTIIEVLVAAVIFMVGFSILIGLLNSSLGRFSARDLTTATRLADEFMSRAMAIQDTTAGDTLIDRSGVSYRVGREVVISNGLAEVTIEVSRAKQGKQLVELYNAFEIR